MRVELKPWYSGLSFLLMLPEERRYVSALQVADITDPGGLHETGTFTREDAQLLMDDLWHCGIRPSSGIGNAGQLAATEKHLGDMRKIAFSRMRIQE